MKVSAPFAAAVVLFFTGGCAAGAADTVTKCSAAVAPGITTRVIATQNDLGFALLHAQRNAVISPLSIGQALGVVDLGARGETATAFLKSSIVPPIDPADFACAAQNLRADLLQADPDVVLQFANALWVAQGFPLRPAFVEKAHAAFGADVTPLDFASPTALGTINGWVSQRTKGHIPTILNSLGAAEAIVTNAVYFKGLWGSAFEKPHTSPDRFNGASGTTRVPFMQQAATFGYYADTSFQLVRLGYRGDRFAMYVVLPAKGTALTMEDTLARRFTGALTHITRRRIDLHLPKLHVAYEANLVSPLTNLGLGIAFSDRADFSGISDRPLKISGVVHKTTLDVDEAGTTATAATAVIMEATARYEPSEVPIVVKVDRPFFCIIRDDQSGAVLFLGAISDVDR